MGRHKLSDVLKDTEVSISTDKKVTLKKEITTDEAKVLCKLGMSQIHHSEKARKALTAFLEHTLSKDEVDDDDADAAIGILRQAATNTHKDLCDKVLTKYLSKFAALISEKK